ncbi:hypothetical protein SAMN02745229_01993 [Butyrivibrio fibrisolvens DSM 3071]|uniref:Uncharacterized protein n=1 Tax=Butyrivibrio fibrisolvens DSM 3071 TaxID=1121131 RepID=A0A1M5Z701_BUTFI|nr:hypothetical protein [Butyrivibrio fibrisolvens]SHI20009.1 hypothetical protein SAMN02745229_01993 [Butyrivibrio fibrisolvens DSM 3071]
MKKNIIITAAVVTISVILTVSAAVYRSKNGSTVTNELDPSLASSLMDDEVSGMVTNTDSGVSSESSITTVPDGVYTNGSESMIFDGNSVDISGMVFDYTLENGYVVLDIDSLSFSDAFTNMYKEEKGEDADLDAQLTKTKESASSITIQYNEKFDWVTYEEYIFKRSEDFSKGPSGTYQSEDDSNITLTFDNGIATFVNGDITETHPYVIYLDGEDLIIVFYSLDLYSSDFYGSFCENNYFYFTDESKIDLGFGSFVKAEK